MYNYRVKFLKIMDLSARFEDEELGRTLSGMASDRLRWPLLDSLELKGKLGIHASSVRMLVRACFGVFFF